MAYKTDPIDRTRVEALLRIADGSPRPLGLKQTEMLDVLRGPLEYRDADGEDEQGNAFAAGDVIVRPHEDLEAVLRAMKLTGAAVFNKERGGWVLTR